MAAEIASLELARPFAEVCGKCPENGQVGRDITFLCGRMRHPKNSKGSTKQIEFLCLLVARDPVKVVRLFEAQVDVIISIHLNRAMQDERQPPNLSGASLWAAFVSVTNPKIKLH